MVVVGSSSLFIGLLFYFCKRAATFVQVCLMFARVAFMFGFWLTAVGTGCMEVAECKRCSRAESAPLSLNPSAGCNWGDGVIMVFVGLLLSLALASAPPSLPVSLSAPSPAG